LRIATFNLENLGLQEVNAQKPRIGRKRVLRALEALMEATGLSGYHLAVSQNREGTGPRDIHNLVTLSRYPIQSTEQLWHDLVEEPHHSFVTGEAAGEDVMLAWDRPVLSWNSVAAWAEGFYLSEIKRAGQALELRAAIDGVFDGEEDALIAVAGDFNSEEHHTPVEIIRGQEENTANGALAGRVMVPVEHSLAADRRFTVIHQGRRQMLDHVVVSSALLGHYQSSEIHNEALTDELVGYAAVEASPVSYHAPVIAVFDL
jgi:endonuclease/exonuclease/phosphatase family metal-dependent hydrolase